MCGACPASWATSGRVNPSTVLSSGPRCGPSRRGSVSLCCKAGDKTSQALGWHPRISASLSVCPGDSQWAPALSGPLLLSRCVPLWTQLVCVPPAGSPDGVGSARTLRPSWEKERGPQSGPRDIPPPGVPRGAEGLGKGSRAGGQVLRTAGAWVRTSDSGAGPALPSGSWESGQQVAPSRPPQALSPDRLAPGCRERLRRERLRRPQAALVKQAQKTSLVSSHRQKFHPYPRGRTPPARPALLGSVCELHRDSGWSAVRGGAPPGRQVEAQGDQRGGSVPQLGAPALRPGDEAPALRSLGPAAVLICPRGLAASRGFCGPCDTRTAGRALRSGAPPVPGAPP